MDCQEGRNGVNLSVECTQRFHRRFMMSTNGTLFFTYRGGEFHKADVAQHFGGKVTSNDDIAKSLPSLGYETMTRGTVEAGEVTFSLWEGPGHQCVVIIRSEGVAPHAVYLDGLLNWLQFQGAILNPALQISRFVHGDA